MADTATTSNTPTTAAQVLDAADPQPKTPGAAASNPNPAAEPDKVASKIQMLSQRERAAVDRERSAKSSVAALEAREAAIAAREAKVQEFESIKQTNPRKALEMLGMSYQDLTQVELQGDGQLTPELIARRAEQKVDSLVQAQEAERLAREEAAQKQDERRQTEAIDKFRGEISDYLTENASRYELIAFEGQESLVYDVIDEHYARTLKERVAARLAEDPDADTSDVRGEVWTIAQGADKVEGHLEKKYAEKAPKLNKLKTFLAPRPPTPPVNKPKQTQPARQSPQTLSNNLSATPAQPRKAPLNDQERVNNAIAWFHNQRGQ